MNAREAFCERVCSRLILTMSSSSTRAASSSENTICLPRTLLRRRAAGTSSPRRASTRWSGGGAVFLAVAVSDAEPALVIAGTEICHRVLLVEHRHAAGPRGLIAFFCTPLWSCVFLVQAAPIATCEMFLCFGQAMLRCV